MSTEQNPRRMLLTAMLGSGLLAAATSLLTPRVFAVTEMPSNRSFYRLKGKVTVNGTAANLGTIVKANDVIETGDKSHAIFVVGKDSFILRSNSRLQLSADTVAPGDNGGNEYLVKSMRLVTGKVLSVFGKQEHRIETPVAVIGIRGTGIYLETDVEETYVCTCYGIADIQAVSDPSSMETITSTHHNAPRYVLAQAGSGSLIVPAPFKNHDDDELLLIETLVGRTTPFIVPTGLRSRRRPY